MFAKRDLPDIDAYFEGKASPEEVAALDLALREDEELRLEFVESANLIAELSLVFCGGEPELHPAPEPMLRWWPLQMAAAFLLVGILGFLLSRPTEVRKVAAMPTTGLALVSGSVQVGDAQAQVGEELVVPGRLLVQKDAVLDYPDGSILRRERARHCAWKRGAASVCFLSRAR